ncbi:carbohydrate ABC transporter permease [Brachyspira pilosicoli]|uniref:Sugar ABC transporter permease n=1 Tax=Brachyspira pilosicoli TaxID=52584 RepID=A0A5C8F428_BRAPL|nr:sugar ABC transporter permease [Brachyspira pilosicoli]TXJ43932.1 sugar ABC transporter permease [Brachyspira pilosicoli]
MKTEKRRFNKDFISGYLFISPSLFFIIVFSIVPLLMVFFFSFQKYNVVQAPEFIGLENYKRMFSDPFMKPALINTFIYTIITVPIQTLLSLLIASIICRKIKSKIDGFVKSSMFVPVIASAILVGAIWRILLSTNDGIINGYLNLIGIKSINWLGDKYLALLSVCFLTIWKNVGYFMVIYIAGILDIPQNLYEAADVDGADKYSKFINITIPALKPINFLVIALGLIWAFQAFEIIYALTSGGPGTATITLVYTIYNTAFRQFNMGFASAVSVLLFIIVLVVSILQKKIMKD